MLKKVKNREAIPSAIIRRVHYRYGGRCGYCGCVPKRICIDHIIPYVVSQDHSEQNLMPCCLGCNSGKQTKSVEEFRQAIVANAMQVATSYHKIGLAYRHGVIRISEDPVVFYFEKNEPLDLTEVNPETGERVLIERFIQLKREKHRWRAVRSPELLARLKTALLAGDSFSLACANNEVSQHTARHWAKQFPEWSELMKVQRKLVLEKREARKAFLRGLSPADFVAGKADPIKGDSNGT